MSRHTFLFPEKPFDPVKAADNVVLYLGCVKDQSAPPRKVLEEGIVLCDYLIDLLEEILQIPRRDREEPPSYKIDDIKSLQRGSIDPTDTYMQIKDAREWFKNIMARDPSPDTNRISDIQKILITTTMPIWHDRCEKLTRRLNPR